MPIEDKFQSTETYFDLDDTLAMDTGPLLGILSLKYKIHLPSYSNESKLLEYLESEFKEYRYITFEDFRKYLKLPYKQKKEIIKKLSLSLMNIIRHETGYLNSEKLIRHGASLVKDCPIELAEIVGNYVPLYPENIRKLNGNITIVSRCIEPIVRNIIYRVKSKLKNRDIRLNYLVNSFKIDEKNRFTGEVEVIRVHDNRKDLFSDKSKSIEGGLFYKIRSILDLFLIRYYSSPRKS